MSFLFFDALIRSDVLSKLTMRYYQSENKPVFSTEMLKNVVNNAKDRAIKDNSENNFKYFIAEDSLRSQFGSSIDPAEVVNEDSNIFYKFESYPLQHRLADIQQTLETNLRTIIGGARGGKKPSDVSVLAETPQYYILYDKLRLIKESLKSEYGLPYTVTEAHRMKAEKILDQLDLEVPTSGAPIWIIRKPTNWYDGQWTVIQTLSHLIQYGMSPTEALDYFMIKTMNAPVQYWANVRGKTNDTIYRHVRQASEKINPQEHPTEPSGYEYMSRTYKNNYIDDTEYITVDNGFLHPRRDISNPSLSGKMTSGYKGAGPRQLAVALLADVFSDNDAGELAHELAGQVHRLASSEEDGTWRLSEEQLQQWYWSR